MLLLPSAGVLSYMVPFPINYMPSASLVLKWYLSSKELKALYECSAGFSLLLQ